MNTVKLTAVLFPAIHGEKDLPLGIIYIAQKLYELGFNVKIVDLNLFLDKGEVDLRDLRRVVEQADLIGFSSYRSTIQADASIMWSIKDFMKDEAIMICGGWGPTLNPDLYLEVCPADIMVRGVHMQALEILELLTRFIRGEIAIEQVKGITARVGDTLLNTPLPMVPAEIPRVKWELIDRFGVDPHQYVEEGTILVPVLGALAPCPRYLSGMGCIYCSMARIVSEYQKIYGNSFHLVKERLARFDHDRVVDDIKSALNYFKRRLGRHLERVSITIVDDTMTPRNFELLYNSLMEDGLMDELGYIKFQTRPDMVERIVNLIDTKYRSKFIIDVGLEFLSSKDLTFTRRGYDKATILRAIDVLKSSGVRWTAYVILSTPFSRAEDLKSNIDLALEVAFKADLLRCNPYLLEENNALSLILDESDFTWHEVVIDCVKKVTVRIPYRPRFKSSLEELKKMLSLVEDFITLTSELRGLVMHSLREENLVDRKEDLVKLVNLEELLSALERLKKALNEDYIERVKGKEI